MSVLISLDNLSLTLGNHSLFDSIKLQIAAGERVCLIGRNGAGKSTLMKIIEGLQTFDSGEIWRKPQLKIARLSQDLPQNIDATVYEYVAEGLANVSQLLADYHHITQRLTQNPSEQDLKRLSDIQQAMDAQQAWHSEQVIATVLTRLGLSPDERVAAQSGGWQRRSALARALVVEPDLLLLDEPTNHLDIEGIKWLEDQLLSSQCGLLFITHDRALLQRLATRIIELDRNQITSWPGDYANFLRRKEEMLEAEAKHHREFDKKLAQEERWIRQGVKARRARNEGRVRALEKLREERAKRYVPQGKVSMRLNESEVSGHLVIEAKNVSQHFNDQCVIRDFSTRIMRGDRVGLLGPNGIGKSTLLNILLGEQLPEQGSVTLGTKLNIGYFDQRRRALEMDKSVIDNIAHGKDSVEINGKSQHIMSYLSDFLFTPKRALMPVKALSGGECNRVLLARLFSQPSNLLVLDEPTNDLDIETLELLEELLSQYQGTLLVVSHDRVFLDNIVSSVLVFSGDGKIEEFPGGYSDAIKKTTRVVKKTVEQPTSPTNKTMPIKKRSYQEQKELTELPKKIEVMEKELQSLREQFADPNFYTQGSDRVMQLTEQLKLLEKNISEAYRRWDSLENE